jgi:hypothetical protein
MQYSMLKNMQRICQICNYIIKSAGYEKIEKYAEYVAYAKYAI